MPWKTRNLEEQRWELVRLMSGGKVSVCELCRRLLISRKTAYKWRRRHRLEGLAGLRGRSHAAQVVPGRPSQVWLERVRQWRRHHPHWGPRKLRRALQRHHGRRGVPSAAALSRWLRRWGLTRIRRRRTRPGPVVARAALRTARRPNDLWTVDFKGWFRTGDGTKVEPLTVRDLASRYVLAVRLLPGQNVERTRREFERLFRARGLPACIRADNGSPFGAKGPGGLTRLSAWWVKLGIAVEFIEPGHPEQNGAHEQLHRVLKAETTRPPARTKAGQQKRSNAWRREYNQERPHEALGLAVPADFYRRSRRLLPRRLAGWKYPAGWESRWVKGNGEISRYGRRRFVGEAFGRERVGLKPARRGVHAVYFGPLLLGELHEADGGGMRPSVHRRQRARK
jgi:transposase InsO family protein